MRRYEEHIPLWLLALFVGMSIISVTIALLAKWIIQ